jgi:hypothetical protein
MDVIEKFANELRLTIAERRLVEQKYRAGEEKFEEVAEKALDQFWKDSDQIILNVVFPTLEQSIKKLQFDGCSCSVRKEGEWRISGVFAVFAIQEGCVDTEAQFEISPCVKNRTIKIIGRKYSDTPNVDYTKEFFEKELAIKDVSPQIIEYLFEATLRAYSAEFMGRI